MASRDKVLFADPFKSYLLTDALSLKIYTTQQIGAPGYSAGGATQALGSYGRSGRQGLRVHISSTNTSIGYYNMLARTMLGVNTTCIFQVAFRYSAAQVNIDLPFFSVLDNATAQVSLVLNRDGTIAAYCGNHPGALLLGTADASLAAGSIMVICGRVVVHPSAGTVHLWFNGSATPSLALTGQNTRASGVTQWTGFALGPRWTTNIFNPVVSNADWDFSDLIVKDGSLALGNGFLAATDPIPDTEVICLLGVTGNGDETDFSVFVGSDHGDMIKDVTPDGDATFNAGGPAAGDKDLYHNEELSSLSGTILAVILEDAMRKDGSGVANVTPLIKSDSVEIPGDVEHTLTDEYVNYRTAFVDFGGDDITPALVNDLQGGPEIT